MKFSASQSFAKFAAGLIAGALICVFVEGNRAQSNGSLITLTQPYSFREDFQHEGLGQWASYPPAQDIGYEPSLSPTSDFSAPGGRSLMRVIKPNRAGFQRFGFIRKVRMTFGSDSRLKFSYRLNSPDSDAMIEVGFAGVDGSRYETKFTAKRNEWNIVDLSISAVRGKPGVSVEAVYIVASLQNADADVTYRFIIDDLTVSAMRESRFEVKTPQSESLEPWPNLISAKSYQPEEVIAIEAIAPGGLASAEWSLETPDGHVIKTDKLYDDGSHGDKTAGDRIWSNSNVYRLSSSDPKGVWLARLRGSASDRQAFDTSIRLIVRPPRASGHPLLFFDAADRQKLIDRSRDPKLTGLWSYLLTTAKSARASGELAHGGRVFEMLDTEYLLPSLLGYFDVLNRARTRIAYNAFEAYITGSDEARSAAKAALLDVTKWKHWEPPWFRAHGQHTYYPAGQLATDVALGYDLLYSDLSEAERLLVRRALIEKSIIPTFKEYVADNRVMANTSNWLAHTVGGALIAAASIASDLDKTENDGRFEIYVGGLLQKLEDHMNASFLADGSYGEGISYHEFDVETLGPALIALRRNFGTDYYQRTRVLQSLTYPLYTLAQPVSGSLDMGDTHPPAGHGIPALVYQSRDPVARWYYSQFDRPSLNKFIFYDDSIQPKAPTLPTSRLFSEKGNAVFRSGWGADDIIFLYRAGPTFNHNHADQGSFLLNAFGENLISEAGWSDYYKDPYYATYFTQAVGHNTVLVDGNPESQSIADTRQFAALNSYPRITDAITSDSHDSLNSELASVYQGRLERFSRRIVFVKPYYFVLFDDLKVSGAPARFDWLLHLPNRASVETGNGTALYRGKRAALVVRAFEPDQCELNLLPGHVPYPEFAARTPTTVPNDPGYLDLRTGPVSATNLLTALIPSRSVEGAKSLAAGMSQIKDSNWLGLFTRREGESDLIMFRVAVLGGEASYGEWLTDAAAWTVTESGGRPVVLSAQSVRSISRSSRVLFRSDRPVSFASRFEANAVIVTVSVAVDTRVSVATGTAPTKVKLDGRDLPASAVRYVAADQTSQVPLSVGQHEIVFTLR
jgi:Heparinase II/III-like protein